MSCGVWNGELLYNNEALFGSGESTISSKWRVGVGRTGCGKRGLASVKCEILKCSIKITLPKCACCTCFAQKILTVRNM